MGFMPSNIARCLFNEARADSPGKTVSAPGTSRSISCFNEARAEEMLAAVEVLDRDEYDVVEIMSETFLDLDQIAQFLNEARSFEPKHDDKLQKLVRLLRSKALAGEKVLVFTEFADTARYLRRELDAAGLDGLEQLDGSTRKNRADVIRRFAPYYNAADPELELDGRDEIRI